MIWESDWFVFIESFFRYPCPVPLPTRNLLFPFPSAPCPGLADSGGLPVGGGAGVHQGSGGAVAGGPLPGTPCQRRGRPGHHRTLRRPGWSAARCLSGPVVIFLSQGRTGGSGVWWVTFSSGDSWFYLWCPSKFFCSFFEDFSIFGVLFSPNESLSER